MIRSFMRQITTFDEFLIQIEAGHFDSDTAPFEPQDIVCSDDGAVTPDNGSDCAARRFCKPLPLLSVVLSANSCHGYLCALGCVEVCVQGCLFCTQGDSFCSCLPTMSYTTKAPTVNRSHLILVEDDFQPPCLTAKTATLCNFAANGILAHSTADSGAAAHGAAHPVYKHTSPAFGWSQDFLPTAYNDSRRGSLSSISVTSDHADDADAPAVNRIAPGLFPPMDITDDSQFMKFDHLPLTPAYVSK